MFLIFSIFLILSANAKDLSDFTDDYYNGLKDYETDPGTDAADLMNRLSNMMVKKSKFYDGSLSGKPPASPSRSTLYQI